MQPTWAQASPSAHGDGTSQATTSSLCLTVSTTSPPTEAATRCSADCVYSPTETPEQPALSTPRPTSRAWPWRLWTRCSTRQATLQTVLSATLPPQAATLTTALHTECSALCPTASTERWMVRRWPARMCLASRRWFCRNTATPTSQTLRCATSSCRQSTTSTRATRRWKVSSAAATSTLTRLCRWARAKLPTPWPTIL